MTIYRIEVEVPCIEVHYVEMSDEDAALISDESALAEIPARFNLTTDLRRSLPAKLLSVEVVPSEDYDERAKTDFMEILDGDGNRRPLPPNMIMSLGPRFPR